MRRLLSAWLLLMLVLVVAACSGQDSSGTVTPRAVSDRTAAAAFTLPNLREGKDDISLVDYRGRPLLINFWAHWCGPCVEEMPALAEFAREHPDIAVLGIAASGDPAADRDFAESTGVGFDLASDRSGDVLGHYGISGLPGTVLVDRQGRVVNTIFGPLTSADLAQLATTLRSS